MIATWFASIDTPKTLKPDASMHVNRFQSSRSLHRNLAILLQCNWLWTGVGSVLSGIKLLSINEPNSFSTKISFWHFYMCMIPGPEYQRVNCSNNPSKVIGIFNSVPSGKRIAMNHGFVIWKKQACTPVRVRGNDRHRQLKHSAIFLVVFKFSRFHICITIQSKQWNLLETASDLTLQLRDFIARCTVIRLHEMNMSFIHSPHSEHIISFTHSLSHHSPNKIIVAQRHRIHYTIVGAFIFLASSTECWKAYLFAWFIDFPVCNLDMCM